MFFETPHLSKIMNVMLFGPSGSGKTYSIKTLLPLGKTVAIDAEGGFMSIMDILGKGEFEYVKARSYGDFVNTLKELALGGHDFKNLVIDSGTELQKLYLDFVGGDKDMPTLQDYGKLANETRKTLRFMRDLPMNLVYITLSKDEKDESTGSIIRKPSLTGKLPDEAMGYVDLTFYLKAQEKDGNIERVFVTQPHERLYAKDRSGKLDRFEPPDFAAIYHKIYGPTEVAEAAAKPAKGKGGKAA